MEKVRSAGFLWRGDRLAERGDEIAQLGDHHAVFGGGFNVGSPGGGEGVAELGAVTGIELLIKGAAGQRWRCLGEKGGRDAEQER